MATKYRYVYLSPIGSNVLSGPDDPRGDGPLLSELMEAGWLPVKELPVDRNVLILLSKDDEPTKTD